MMRDYAELVKALRCCLLTSERGCAECPFGLNNNEKCANLLSDAADAIEELLARNDKQKMMIRKQSERTKKLLAAVPQWISVEEALPKNAGQMCLVCAKNSFGQQSVFNAFTGYGDFNWYTYDTTKMRSRLDNNNAIALGWEITHWMPLPEAPKGE